MILLNQSHSQHNITHINELTEQMKADILLSLAAEFELHPEYDEDTEYDAKFCYEGDDFIRDEFSIVLTPTVDLISIGHGSIN